MTTVVTGNCERSRFTDCVTVCPVDCFHADDLMLYIDPETCIDCAACISVCPVQAIFTNPIPDAEQRWIEINSQMAANLPVIKAKQEPYPGAERRSKQLGF